MLDKVASVEGPNLRLRLVEPSDAEYIHALRTNPAYNTHLSAVSGTVEDQRTWIEGYKAREADLRELYYVIERKDGTRCGLVRLYDINPDSFTWGSWILDEKKPPKAALESAVLVYVIGFELLGKSFSIFDVRNDNDRTLGFHARFGATQTGKDETNTYFEISANTFNESVTAYLDLLRRVET